MILGNHREQVIENIQRAIQENDFHRKVEPEDPFLSSVEKEAIVTNYLQEKNTIGYQCKNSLARAIANFITWHENRKTKIVGIEHLSDITGGAIITCNHFSPLDNTVIRFLTRKCGKKNLYIVSQESNMAMQGIVGFLMRYADTIPVSARYSYMKERFPNLLKSLLEQKQYILIYPEEEMWFHYRKPRPLKRGAYHYAAQFHVPIISCFIEIQDCTELDNDLFHKVRYILHVLPTIYPDASLSERENSLQMQKQDELQKRTAYEIAYGKPLSNTFDLSDIAGLSKAYEWKGAITK